MKIITIALSIFLLAASQFVHADDSDDTLLKKATPGHSLPKAITDAHAAAPSNSAPTQHADHKHQDNAVAAHHEHFQSNHFQPHYHASAYPGEHYYHHPYHDYHHAEHRYYHPDGYYYDVPVVYYTPATPVYYQGPDSDDTTFVPDDAPARGDTAFQCGNWLEEYHIVPYQDWGRTPVAIQHAWDDNDCNHQVCQYFANAYHVIPYQSWGGLPPNYQAIWDNPAMDCNHHVE